jgi:NAD(P)-dependent dehydrogenase (short-subunit alcohol dehydrogenase family)
MDLSGRTALLTGATGGLGRAIATALAARGARLILSSRKAEELVKVARSLPGGGHTPLVSDLAEDGAALALLDQALAGTR